MHRMADQAGTILNGRWPTERQRDFLLRTRCKRHTKVLARKIAGNPMTALREIAQAEHRLARVRGAKVALMERTCVFAATDGPQLPRSKSTNSCGRALSAVAPTCPSPSLPRRHAAPRSRAIG
jgi:hypothetical protein